MNIPEFTVSRYRDAIDVLTPLYAEAVARGSQPVVDEEALDISVLNAMHDENLPGVMVAVEEWKQAWETAINPTRA